MSFKKGDKVFIKKGSRPYHSGDFLDRAMKDIGLHGIVTVSYGSQCQVKTHREDSDFYWPSECLILCNDLEREQMLELESVL